MIGSEVHHFLKMLGLQSFLLAGEKNLSALPMDEHIQAKQTEICTKMFADICYSLKAKIISQLSKSWNHRLFSENS